MLDLDTMKWQKIEFKTTDNVPRARSAFIMAVNGDTLFVYGGYSKEKKSKYAEPLGIVHTGIMIASYATYTLTLTQTTFIWT